MTSKVWRWSLGLSYIIAVAIIWIAASFVVQSVVDSGVSPFLITYICNSLFIVYLPLVEIARYVEDSFGSWRGNKDKDSSYLEKLGETEEVVLLGGSDLSTKLESLVPLGSIEEGGTSERAEIVLYEPEMTLPSEVDSGIVNIIEDISGGLDSKGRWTRTRTAKVSLLICPFWFLAQLTFNLSLKYTTVTSNTILSTASSLFTFFLALIFLGERLEPFHALSWKQIGLIIGKGLLDNVLSDYLWAKAVLLTSTTVATAGLTIQVPLAAIVDSITGHAPHLMDYFGAAAVMVGFAGINIPSDACCSTKDVGPGIADTNVVTENEDHN
ncbi:hypothetical protein IFM89_010362 [Coptis chinensis]|uniref:EamA domain-containing protein n=1 Tax=Coptis chinensis TaxID=261450 RepID=A0A835HU61_9MAGN|nr:hypothetical protein IFM89_010362 [Coptis chinensis]